MARHLKLPSSALLRLQTQGLYNRSRANVITFEQFKRADAGIHHYCERASQLWFAGSYLDVGSSTNARSSGRIRRGTGVHITASYYHLLLRTYGLPATLDTGSATPSIYTSACRIPALHAPASSPLPPMSPSPPLVAMGLYALRCHTFAALLLFLYSLLQATTCLPTVCHDTYGDTHAFSPPYSFPPTWFDTVPAGHALAARLTGHTHMPTCLHHLGCLLYHPPLIAPRSAYRAILSACLLSASPHHRCSLYLYHLAFLL